MSNEEIINELLLKFKGLNKGAKTHLTDTIRRDIVKDLHFNTENVTMSIIKSGYFNLHPHDAISLNDYGFEYVNQTNY